MTDRELWEAAWAELTQTTVTYDRWRRQGFTPGHWANAKKLGDQIGAVVPPPPVGPPAPPPLVNPKTVVLTNANRGSALAANTGDVSASASEIISGGQVDVQKARNMILTGANFDYAAANSTCLVPRELTGTLRVERCWFHGAGMGDCIVPRWRVPVLQIVGCRFEINSQGGFHADGLQTQETESDLWDIYGCSFRSNYQCVFLSNEPSSRSGGRSRVGRVRISHCDFAGPVATYLFKAFPPRPGTDEIGPVEIGDDVYIDTATPLSKVFPNGTTWVAWDGTPSRYGAFLETDAQGQYVRFSTPADTVPTGAFKGQQAGDCRITGKLRVGKPPVEFAPASAWK